MAELPEQVLRLIDLAVAEDLGPGDVTSEAVIDAAARGEARVVARQPLVCCGLDLLPAVFERVGTGVTFRMLVSEGEDVNPGTVMARVNGPLRTLLSGERTALNFLQRMSGIATLSRVYAEKASGRTVILDSRKTVPGWRWLDKRAVRAGGCRNHRMGLYDGVLIKDNHIAACGGITEAVSRVRSSGPEGVAIEVEVENLEGLEEAIRTGVDIVMLDNFTPREVAAAVALNAGRVRLEVSGNITLESMDRFLTAGKFDYLSVGELTHSARSADIALEIGEEAAL